MLNKKGFTLIEIIAVVVLLSIITLLIIPSVMGSIDKTKQIAYNQMVGNIESVTKLYISENKNNIPNINVINSDIKISLQQLIDSGLIKGPIQDPITGDTIDSIEKKVSVCVIGKNEYYISYVDIPSCEARDFVGPEITLLGLNPIIVYLNDVYHDPGAKALDARDGEVSVTYTSNVDTAHAGKYTVTYNAVDSAGNKAITVVRTVIVVDTVYTLYYKNTSQTFVVPVSGLYKIEAFGAQGEGPGGKGGYVLGNIMLPKGASVTVLTGGTDGTNGGGNGVYRGGGATTVRYNGNIILIAAGGGGGPNGTSGGNDDASGGAYQAGAGVTTPATGTAGSAGINGGGGGSGNKYRDCTGYEQIYTACIAGSNTCVPGYVNGTCNTYNSCTNSACGYATCQNAACGKSCSCSSGWSYDGTDSCYKGTSTRTLWRWYKRSCDCTCHYRYEAYGPPVQCFNSATNYITDGIYYNTSTCDSACSQKNTGTVGGTCGGQSKHYSGSGTCSKVYTSWSTSSSKPSSSYNSSWYETKTEAYCPTGTLSGSNCWIIANCWYNSCATSACGYATCRTSACGCQIYNQVYSPCVTGSNTCVDGYQNGACNAFTSEKYISGKGGRNNVNTTIISNSSSIFGSNTGNGYVRITLEEIE